MRNTGAVILAAGESTRLGRPKQLLKFRGATLVRRTVEAARTANCSPVVLVVGSNAETVAREVSATVVENGQWRRGIGSSIRAGVKHVIGMTNASLFPGIVLLVCDQPFVDAAVIRHLIELQEKTGKAIVASEYAETLGVPALFDHSCFEELLSLTDEGGAKEIILRDRARVAEFPFPQGAIDIDTPQDYENLE